MNKYFIYLLVVLFADKRIKYKVNKKDFVKFNGTNIKGELKKIRIVKNGIWVKLKEGNSEFVFYPNTGDLNGNNKFNDISEIGDIVIKPAYSDTLRLIKNGKVFLYTFQKFNL